jgi:hypothetical protein
MDKIRRRTIAELCGSLLGKLCGLLLGGCFVYSSVTGISIPKDYTDALASLVILSMMFVWLSKVIRYEQALGDRLE